MLPHSFIFFTTTLIPTFIVSTWFLNRRTIPRIFKNEIRSIFNFVSRIWQKRLQEFLNKHDFVLYCCIILITLNITILGTETCTGVWLAEILRDFYRIFFYRSFLKHRPIFDYLSFVLKLCIELDPTERMNERTRNGIWDFLTRPAIS